MLRPTLSRYRILAGCIIVLAAWAVIAGHGALAAALFLVLLVAIGFGTVFPQFKFFGPYVCRGNISRRCVALTFDDGPDPRSTPALLDLLRATRTPAAFFCIGNRVEAERALAARIVEEGHLCENHTYSHHNLTNVFTVPRLRDELTRAQSVIQQATGVAPQCMRPPMGLSNPRLFRVARSLGLKVIGWSARGLDTKLKDPEEIVKRIARRLEPGAIILLHDGNISPEQLLPTVRKLLDTLRALDYEVVRLDHILK